MCQLIASAPLGTPLHFAEAPALQVWHLTWQGANQKVLTCSYSCRLRQLIAKGTIGEVQHFQGTFVAHIGEETPRLYDPNLGGGALLDIGVSCGVLQLCTGFALHAARLGWMLRRLHDPVGWSRNAEHWDEVCGASRTAICCMNCLCMEDLESRGAEPGAALSACKMLGQVLALIMRSSIWKPW